MDSADETFGDQPVAKARAGRRRDGERLREVARTLRTARLEDHQRSELEKRDLLACCGDGSGCQRHEHPAGDENGVGDDANVFEAGRWSLFNASHQTPPAGDPRSRRRRRWRARPGRSSPASAMNPIKAPTAPATKGSWSTVSRRAPPGTTVQRAPTMS